MTSEVSTHTRSLSTRELAREYYQITKPRVVGLIMFTAIAGMFLASPTLPGISVLLLATIGIGLAAASGAAVNHVLDEDKDFLMKRTRNRPLPSGTIDTRSAMIFACMLAAISMLVLVLGVNTLTAFLTFASLIGYAVIYTIFLKYATPQNIVIGGAAGAMPPVLGWTAVTGTLSSDAVLLFLIIFCWTPPHFWALALYRAQDYQTAEIPMLPVTHGEKLTRLHVMLYTVLLTAVTIMPFATGMFGYIYLSAALVLNTVFILLTVRLYVRYTDQLSRRVFKFSIQYLAALFTMMLIDHYLMAAIA
ncbi:MAG: heme o synthase [Acidiferrobacterales bacterium]|nr:heme o synthase [Acidiferrobacterales bacterium]